MSRSLSSQRYFVSPPARSFRPVRQHLAEVYDKLAESSPLLVIRRLARELFAISDGS
jgi:hypothetical protein